MEGSAIVCPVCSLYLREGITLKAHLGTHPKEKVIEALLKATDVGTTTVQSMSPPVQAYLPPTLSGSAYMATGQQFVAPSAQMATAVTYQHFMTNGSPTLVPHYIQVPTIVAPSGSVPIIPQPYSYVPSTATAAGFPQTMYNPIYNPYIPQPYPLNQTASQPCISNYPVTELNSTIVNSDNQSSQISVISNTPLASQASVNIAPLTNEVESSQRCSIATNTVALTEEMDLSDCKSEETNSAPPSPVPSTPVKRTANRAMKAQAKLNRTSNLSVLTVSKVSSKTSVITTAKPKVTIMPSYSSYSTSSSMSSNSGIISPPPLTLSLINRSRSSSLSCSQTPPPLPPLTIAPGHVRTSSPYVKQEDLAEDSIRVQSPELDNDQHIISINKVREYLNHQVAAGSVNSVIVESNVTTIHCSNSAEVHDADIDNEKVADDLNNSKIEDNQMEGTGEMCFDQPFMDFTEECLSKTDDIIEYKENFVDLNNQEIPNNVSATVGSNCVGSDMFMQEHNIPFLGSQELSCVKSRLTTPTTVGSSNNSQVYSDLEIKSTLPDVDVNTETTPQYTVLRPATYTELQPATGSQVLKDISITKPLNFTNCMEFNGIRIFFSNGTSTNNTSSSLKVNKSRENILSTFCVNLESGHVKETMGSSVIQRANYVSEAGQEKETATTSQFITEKQENDNMSPVALNIRADESMPARGELSEQESLGADNSNWGLYRGDEPREWKPNVSGFSVRPTSVETSTTKKSFKCSLCNNRFSCPKERRVHKNTVHMIDGPKTISESNRRIRKFKCRSCDQVFNGVRERRQHNIDVHIAEEKSRKSLQTETIKKEIVEGQQANRYFMNVQRLTSEVTTVVKDETDMGEVKPELDGLSVSSHNVAMTRRCVKCPSTFISAKKLKEHMREMHGDVKFQCGTCPLSFDEENEYNNHLKIHPLVCSQCGKLFYRKPNLSLHMKRHLKVKPYECSLCPKSFITRQKLEEHTNGHAGKKPIKCKLCDRSFSRHSNLIQHKNTHHFKVKRKLKDYVCRCGEVFHSLRKLEWHKEVHDSKPKTCPFCAQKFIHSASVTRHVRRAHLPAYLPGDNREYENVQCPICDRIYLRSSLIVHMRVHNGEKPFVCQICSKRFSTKWNLELHNWTHQTRSNMPFKCSTCKSAFFRESDYIAHLNSHKNFKPFTCNICGQKFIRKYNCLRHQEEHRKAKRFTCTISGCDKSFHRSYYLKDHMKVHTGVRPHTCHVCGKASSTKSNHNKHVRIHDTREPVNTEN